jgi:hypothetical protein
MITRVFVWTKNERGLGGRIKQPQEPKIGHFFSREAVAPVSKDAFFVFQFIKALFRRHFRTGLQAVSSRHPARLFGVVLLGQHAFWFTPLS